MVSRKISGAEYPLSKIFSSDFEFVIPDYQRPYAWTREEAGELIDDLADFHRNQPDEGYFLGSIVLIKAEGLPRAEVIDGQQRLMTLTILLAAMATAHGGCFRDQLRSYILEPGKEMEGILPKPRLTPRGRDREFFKDHIQSIELAALAALDPAQLENEAQRNIKGNAGDLFKEVEQRFPTPDDLKAFIQFLLTRCFLVTVSTPTQESAFRVFSVMNSRGLDLRPTDIIKADVIGPIKDDAARRKCNERWEEMEVDLSRAGFNDLFSYIRMIHVKEKAKISLLEEFREHVLPVHPDPVEFMEKVLRPYAEALGEIRSASYAAASHSEEVNELIGWLNRIDNSDWIPPAMLFLSRHRNTPEVVVRFFRRLERLAAVMHVDRWYVNDRIERYARIIREIEAGKTPEDIEALKLSETEVRDFRRALDGDIYRLTPRRRNFVLLRLDSFLADGGASYDPKILTVEHVLPQTVEAGSEWESWWPDPGQRGAWVHRIANLVPLSKKKNSAAQNYDFARKRSVYFSGPKNVSSYALTSQVIGTKSWTPDIVAERQKALVNIMMDGWRLKTA